MLSVTQFTTTLVLFTGVTLILGFARAFPNRAPVLKHLIAFISLVLLGYLARSSFWEYIGHHDLAGYYKTDINVFFDLIVFWGTLHGHMAILGMIPEDERGKYTFLTAWTYPPRMLFSKWLGR